jgi:cysteine desulfurase / selenocysteine lyase
MNLDELRSEFPVTQEWIYLNHAAVAPLCRPAAKAMRRIVRDVEHGGIAHISEWSSLYAKTRRSAANLLGCRADEIALLKNTTEGIITVANGIRWRRGDNAILAAGQFPANVYPWLNLESQGVEIRQVPCREDGQYHPEDFAAAMDTNTRVLSLSSVDFFSGSRCDLPTLGALCRSHDVFFFVDAIQSLGAFPIDVKEAGIDFVAADAHKWLVGPEGAAIFYCDRRALNKLEVRSLGWSSVASAYEFHNYERELHPDARRFECGTLNTAGIAAIKASIDFLLDVGIEAISQRITDNCRYLSDSLRTKGYRIIGPSDEKHRAGIVTVNHPDHACEPLAQHLQDHRVLTTVRGGHLRFSPHFYNTFEELDLALALLP